MLVSCSHSDVLSVCPVKLAVCLERCLAGVLCICFLVTLFVWKRSLTLFYGLLDRVGSQVETNGKVATDLTLRLSSDFDHSQCEEDDHDHDNDDQCGGAVDIGYDDQTSNIDKYYKTTTTSLKN